LKNGGQAFLESFEIPDSRFRLNDGKTALAEFLRVHQFSIAPIGLGWLNRKEHGDVEEALNAASAIGDDRLQRRSRGYVTPDSFTHGTSSQRMHWFRVGLETGSIGRCNTFQAAEGRR
jgi:hypothetical protein